MRNETVESSRLFGLIGEAAGLLPDNAIASLEVMLALQEKLQQRASAVVPADVRNTACGIGSESSTALGCQEREALSTILEILHASHQDEGEGHGRDFDDRLVEGLILCGRLIVDRQRLS